MRVKLNKLYILLTIITVAQNEAVLSYHRVRGLYFLAVIFAATIVILVSFRLTCLIICFFIISCLKLSC